MIQKTLPSDIFEGLDLSSAYELYGSSGYIPAPKVINAIEEEINNTLLVPNYLRTPGRLLSLEDAEKVFLAYRYAIEEVGNLNSPDPSSDFIGPPLPPENTSITQVADQNTEVSIFQITITRQAPRQLNHSQITPGYLEFLNKNGAFETGMGPLSYLELTNNIFDYFDTSPSYVADSTTRAQLFSLLSDNPVNIASSCDLFTLLAKALQTVKRPSIDDIMEVAFSSEDVYNGFAIIYCGAAEGNITTEGPTNSYYNHPDPVAKGRMNYGMVSGDRPGGPIANDEYFSEQLSSRVTAVYENLANRFPDLDLTSPYLMLAAVSVGIQVGPDALDVDFIKQAITYFTDNPDIRTVTGDVALELMQLTDDLQPGSYFPEHPGRWDRDQTARMNRAYEIVEQTQKEEGFIFELNDNNYTLAWPWTVWGASYSPE